MKQLNKTILKYFSHKLRRIIRKSFLLTETHFKIQPGYSLLCDIADEILNILGDAYPELIENNKKVKYINSV